MDVAGLEFVQDGHGHGAVGQGGQEAHAPVGLVAGTDGHLVSPEQPALLESDVQFLDAAGHVPVFKGDALVVGQGRTVPVLAEALLEEKVDGRKFHVFCSNFGGKVLHFSLDVQIMRKYCVVFVLFFLLL